MAAMAAECPYGMKHKSVKPVCFFNTFGAEDRGAVFDMNVTRGADRLVWKSVQEHITVIIKMFRY